MPALTQVLFQNIFLIFGDNMKCIITGHSSGIGMALFIHYSKYGWHAHGMSRTNGYDISTDIDKIVEAAKGCDLFINNAYDGKHQLALTKALSTVVPKIVIMGAAITDHMDLVDSEYARNKKELEDFCRVESLKPNVADILFLKISFAETELNRPKENRIDSDFVVTYEEIAKVIDFWLSNPKIRQVDFRVKLTDYTVESIKRKVGDSASNYLDDLFLKYDGNSQ
jgi:hypothetical protein